MPGAAHSKDMAGWYDYLEALVPRIQKLGLPDPKIDEAISQWSGQKLPYTSSIDAALSLVKTCLPVGFGRHVDATLPKAGITVELFVEGDEVDYEGDHQIEACATLLALLQYVLLNPHNKV